MLDKDYYAAVDDYNHAVLSAASSRSRPRWVFPPSSLIRDRRSLRLLASLKRSSTSTLPDTVSRVGGITLEDIDNDVDVLHSTAFDPLGLDADLTLDSVGSHKMRRSGQEEHLYNPRTIHLLQQATRTGSYEMFKEYTIRCRRGRADR